MKKNLWLIIPAIALVFGITVVGCDDDSGGGGSGSGGNTQTYTGTADGQTYTLKITKAARYTAKSGDDYELTGGSKKSEGTVSNVSGSTLTLKPSNAANAADTFTATVSGKNLTKLEGTIKRNDNTTAAAPGALTGTGNSGGNTGGGSGFTITDIPSKYNGKYVSCVLTPGGVNGVVVSASSMKNARISNRTASVPIREISPSTPGGRRYSGNDTFTIYIYIENSETSTMDSNTGKTGVIETRIFNSVNFSNGNATRAWSDGQEVGTIGN